MTTLILFILSFFKTILFNPAAEKVVFTGIATITWHVSEAQIKQPNASIFPLVREYRIYIPYFGQTGPSLYDIPASISVDSNNIIKINGRILKFDSLYNEPENTDITRFIGMGSNSSAGWVSWNKIVQNMAALRGADTTFPNDVIMTTSKANAAISSMENDIDNRQTYSDSSTWDATHSWTNQRLTNYYPYTNPLGFINSISGPMVVSAIGFNPVGYAWLEWDSIRSKPAFKSIATTASYYDLTDTPNISEFVTIPYLNSALWPYATLDDIALKVSISDTSSMLHAYSRIAYVNTMLSGKLNISDFASTFNTNFSGKSTSDLNEGVNLYFTNGRARNAISLTTTGSGAASYNSSTGVLNIPTPTALPALGTANQLLRVNAGGSAMEWFTPSFLTANQNITLSGDITGSGTTAITTTLANSGVSSGTYRSSVTVDAKGRVTAATNPTVNNSVSRSISNAAGSTNRYTISSTLPAFVTYSITMNFTVTALLSSSATVYLEYSTDGGTNWILVSQVTTSFGLGLALTGSNDMSLSGYVPANALVRLRPSTTNSTVSFNIGQEVLY